MTVTVPTVYVFLVLLVPVAVVYVAAARWADRRWLDPWLRRRAGLPPRPDGTDGTGT